MTGALNPSRHRLRGDVGRVQSCGFASLRGRRFVTGLASGIVPCDVGTTGSAARSWTVAAVRGSGVVSCCCVVPCDVGVPASPVASKMMAWPAEAS
jgi:hypothetical protein